MSDSVLAADIEEYFVRVLSELDPWPASTTPYEEDVRQWCRAEELECNRPAIVAYWILHERKNWNLFHTYSSSSLPDRSDSEGWDAMLQWRHPRVDLNLLQLAAVCDSRRVVGNLNGTVLAREENYRDKNAKLVNHPVHLACRLGCNSALLGMTSISSKVLCEEGVVDLTAARLNSSPSTEGQGELNTDDGFTSGASADSVDLPTASSDNELLALLMRNDPKCPDSAMPAVIGEIQVTGTPLVLIGQGDSRCVPTLLERLVENLFKALPRPQQFAVDSLRNTLREVRRSGMPDRSLYYFVLSFSHLLSAKVETLLRLESGPSLSGVNTQTHVMRLHDAREEVMWCREMLILVCQLLWCLPKEEVSSIISLKAVHTIFRFLTYESASQSYQKAASYLPQKHLSNMIEAFQKEARTSQQQQDPTYASMEIAVQVLKEVARDRRLQDLCLLPILQSVRGDARAARNLSALPEPLRKRFHVPFQDLYDQLYSGTQASNRT